MESGMGEIANLKVSQDSTECRWLRQFPMRVAGNCGAATSVEMATELTGVEEKIGESCIERKEDGGGKPPLQDCAGHFSAAGMKRMKWRVFWHAQCGV
jgi:hypothetical protein